MGKGRHNGIGEWPVLLTVYLSLSHRRLTDYVGNIEVVKPDLNRSRVIGDIVVCVSLASSAIVF